MDEQALGELKAIREGLEALCRHFGCAPSHSMVGPPDQGWPSVPDIDGTDSIVNMPTVGYGTHAYRP